MDKSPKEKIKIGNDELIGKGNLNIIEEIFAPGYVVHASGKDYKGHKFIERFIGQLRTAIPDIKVVKIEFFIQAGTTIAWQRTLSGTHLAEMMGAHPSGQKLKWSEIVISRFENDKIVEEWMVSELAGEMLSKPPLV